MKENTIFDCEILCDKRREREKDEKLGLTKDEEEYDIWFPMRIDLRKVCAIREDDDGGSGVFMDGGHYMYVNAPFKILDEAWVQSMSITKS